MSIIISVRTSEGVVLAADSRQSYTNARGNTRVGTDYGAKVFQLTSRIGVATFGWAFLQPQTANVMFNISALIEDFRATINPDNIGIQDVANQLSLYFQQIYNYDINTLHWNAAPAGQFAIGFQVCGYNQNSTVGEAYLCQIPPGNSTLLGNTNNPGSNWNGQIDVVTRLILGYDPRAVNLPFVQHIINNPIPNQDNLEAQLRGLQYIINWSNMTLQDAVDFVILMVNSTIKMQRFSDGIIMNAGDIPGCGGDVDVAVITHRDGFRWVRRKELKADI